MDLVMSNCMWSYLYLPDFIPNTESVLNISAPSFKYRSTHKWSDHLWIMVQVLLHQNYRFLKTHAKIYYNCFFVDMNSDHFRVRLCLDLYHVAHIVWRLLYGLYFMNIESKVSCSLWYIYYNYLWHVLLQ